MSLRRTLLCVLLLAGRAGAQRPADAVVLVTMDGLRWQEVFAGADSTILADTIATPARDAVARYWRPTPAERRAALLPFLWSVVAREGQVFGDRFAGGAMRVTNGRKFSYPGYQELLAGYPDSTIDSNAKRPNHNVTVLEWLHTRPGYRGRVAAFGTWDVFPYIINEDRSGVPVNAGWEALALPRPTERQALLNTLMADLPHVLGEEERFDALTFRAALEYLREARPRVLYIALGETDDWAHRRRYDRYLDAARRGDAFVRELWETLQSLPEYRGRTALIVTTDHGRGPTVADWPHHGASVVDAEWIWAAVLGPGVAARGSRVDVTDATQAQIAATLAALLGEDYVAAQPRAALPLAGVVP
jgi:hypothetical protein